MPKPVSDPAARTPPAVTSVLRLVVRNHPGVMSHVCGLFARRAFNLEGIVCLPVSDGSRSAMLLLVQDDARLGQLQRQLDKLEDVLEVSTAVEARGLFETLSAELGRVAAAVG